MNQEQPVSVSKDKRRWDVMWLALKMIDGKVQDRGNGPGPMHPTEWIARDVRKLGPIVTRPPNEYEFARSPIGEFIGRLVEPTIQNYIEVRAACARATGRKP